jgi:hypothetical protein
MSVIAKAVEVAKSAVQADTDGNLEEAVACTWIETSLLGVEANSCS